MEIVWEDPPSPDGPFFTRDLYEKHSFAPNIRELWSFLQSSQEISTDKENSGVHAGGPPAEEHVPEQNDSIKEENSCDSEDSCIETEDSKSTKEELRNNQENQVPFPDPRVPYPCVSALTKTEQKKYLDYLMSHMKKKKPLPQALLTRVNNEVRHFMMYLQDVSRMCAEDYNVISQGALQYSEELFRSSLEYIKTVPQLYKIHELTSLTGGKFNPGLTLTFEKQLLIMGNVDITDFKPVHVDAQLASDYQSVSSQTPPAKKAKDMHASISSDSNAEKLCSNYEPHVCLTREALVQLLNNQGPDFREQWELPVLIKINPTKGKSKKKTVFIDSPLLKTEATVRERSHIYHEESLKLSITKNGTKNVFHIMTELPVNEQPVLERSLLSFENDSLDFEVDLSDLETFGESASNKATKIRTKKEEDGSVNSEKATSETKSSCKISESSSLEEEMDTTQCDSLTTKATQKVKCETAEPLRKISDQETDSCALLNGDSDNEKLIIDDTSPKITPELKPSVTPDSEFRSPFKATRSKVQLRKAQPCGDQLGEILRMQTAMFSSNVSDSAKSSNVPQDANSPSKRTGSTHSHPTSLVKACVSSYLERNPNQEEETGDALHTAVAPVMNRKSTELKRILSEELQAAAEDEHDYESPEEGNVLYKLYSLDDLLLMVRSSISFAQARRVDGNQNTSVPVNIFPKLEYQLSYGVECLSSSEACRLWTETLLHSSTVSYIAHINALTSRVALLRKLPDDWIQNVSCGFKPSKSLNILHHLLKKLTGLDEGQYLLGHKVGEPFVNILKAANGNGRQGVYNLQQIHSDVPQPPTSASVPWVPVDPSVYLPFHRKHGRVPCTFPPKEFTQTKAGTSQPRRSRGAPPGYMKPTKMQKKRKRAAKSRK